MIISEVNINVSEHSQINNNSLNCCIAQLKVELAAAAGLCINSRAYAHVYFSITYTGKQYFYARSNFQNSKKII